jgi:hypothetical protein
LVTQSWPTRTHSASAVLIRAARALGRRLAPNALTVAGLASIDMGAFYAHPVAGFMVTGVSLLVLDWKVDE